MTKHVYVYLRDADNYGSAVESMVQLVELTGMNYRTIQRKMEKADFFLHPSGKFRIYKVEYIRDARTGNGDVNINKKYK